MFNSVVDEILKKVKGVWEFSAILVRGVREFFPPPRTAQAEDKNQAFHQMINTLVLRGSIHF